MTKAKSASRKKRTPQTAVEGIGWTRHDENGEIKLRCHRCDRSVPVMNWWEHGASDPCTVVTRRSHVAA